ncbi:glutaminase [Cetobacterium sp.]
MGVAVFGPALDAEGNSVAGMGIMKDISKEMELDMF